MVRRFLVTTAIEETWPISDEPILFLGEWCRIEKRKLVWENRNFEVAHYHWDDREKLYKDYCYLQALYKILIKETSAALNTLHGEKHSIKYWKIIIGPWLGFFIQMLFDRWSSIKCVEKNYKIENTFILNIAPSDMVPSNMNEFLTICIEDKWNHYIYGYIIQNFSNLKYRLIENKRNKIQQPNIIKKKLKLIKLVANKLQRIFQYFSKKKDAFLITTYLNHIDSIKLQFRLRQFPQFWRSQLPVVQNVNFSMRKWALESSNSSEFEVLVRELIPLHIPTAYLEGHKALINQSKKLPWPEKPKFIWTSNSHEADDLFKTWAAEKNESGVPLIIGQHGGHYGTGKWCFMEEHELDICDKYLSWGWSVKDRNNILQIGKFKKTQKNFHRNSKSTKLILTTASVPRYSYWMYSIMISGQLIQYFEDQISFVKSLPQEIQQEVRVRLYPTDYGWNERNRWINECEGIGFSNPELNLQDEMKNCKLFVTTYNATTFLESISLDVPTIIFWNPNHWELRDSAQYYFEELRKAKILHFSPKSASEHISIIWKDVDAWWNSDEVFEAVKRFKARFIYSRDNFPKYLADTFKKEIF